MHRIVSFYQEDLPEELVVLQKRVFDHFSIPLEQVKFPVDNNGHAYAIEDYLRSTHDWSSITIFDVDCVPFERVAIDRALDLIKDGNTIYGNIQASNTGEHSPYKSLPFAAPSFLNFTRNIWDDYIKIWDNKKTTNGVFQFQHYPNPDGIEVEADVAEVFNRENEKRGVRIMLAYPTKSPYDDTWKYKAYFGYPYFSYGNCTEFASGTCHNFQIRIPDKQRYFIKYCNNILNENK
jgi:hypothetical protein